MNFLIVHLGYNHTVYKHTVISSHNVYSGPATFYGTSYQSTPANIRHQRWGVGSLSQEEAAELCSVSLRTWRNWESGKNKIPTATWNWFVTMTTGLVYHKDWEGWSFSNGKLMTPEGEEYSPGEVKSICFLKQVLERKKNEHKRQLPVIGMRMPEVIAKRHEALGALGLLSQMCMNLQVNYEDNDDALLSQISNRLKTINQDTVNCRVEIIRELSPSREFKNYDDRMNYLSQEME
tara:strand:- start:1267 stop:1971 length:705 start_codon:yes stop_codon:yes gene_type:complete